VNDCLVWVPKKLLVTCDRWGFFGEQPFSIFGVFSLVFSLQFFPVTTTGCTKNFVQPVILTSLFFHVLFFPPTAPCAMMANDAQEETSCDTKRRVQQFIKGTIEMQNDERFNGLTSEAGSI
jgi:Na+/melibiose symporter-like transporter